MTLRKELFEVIKSKISALGIKSNIDFLSLSIRTLKKVIFLRCLKAR